MTLENTQLKELSLAQQQLLRDKERDYAWRALNIYAVYRIAIIIFLLFLINANVGRSIFVLVNTELFFTSLIFYLAFAFICLVINLKRTFHFRVFVYSQIFIDIALTMLLLHFAGGLSSGLGMLLIVSCVSAALLLSELKSLLFAALASLSLLGQQFYILFSDLTLPIQFPQAGMMGAACFASSFIAILYSQRLKESERLSALRSASLERMERLNEQVIKHMRTGVVLVDENAVVKVINQAAWKALGTPEFSEDPLLKDISEALFAEYYNWKDNSNYQSDEFRAKKTAPLLKPNFTSLDEQNKYTLILLEDRSLIAQQAQSLKLTSLGRLTASIAHEIRNPLSSINHAAELLHESDNMQPSDMRLSELIHNNAKRMNSTIESILQLTQKKVPHPKKVDLNLFIKNFISEYHQFVSNTVTINLKQDKNIPMVFFDPHQLEQILTNLVKNGARHSKDKINREIVELHVYQAETHDVLIDVIDQGDGVAKENREKLFEPFFTTSTTGTGLGLFLARELCQGNQAQLDYVSRSNNNQRSENENKPESGACFRITIADEQ